MNVCEKFLNYVKVETTSNEESETCPSTAVQLDLAKILVEELNILGLEDISLDDNGYIMATLKANTDKDIPSIGFISHMDTSPDISGKDVKPRIIENYDGEDIVLNETLKVVLSTKEYPSLLNYKGKDLIVTDGTTLLGADDKAGVAEIMSAMEYLINHPEIKHGTIKVAFTPDEEIGRGTDKFDAEKFGTDFAYTVDGGEIGELEYENFNAANAWLTINGNNIHPGSAKNKMLSAMEIAFEFDGMLPPNERPQFTEGYEGFYHLVRMGGNVEQVKMVYILRDHDKELYYNKKDYFTNVVNYLNLKYGDNTVECDLRDMYFNMKEKVEPVMHIVETATEAMKAVGVEPIIVPIRGGTDGSRLSYMGIPCPNLFTGGHNFHGKYEYICIQSMHKAVETIVKIIELYAQK
ncbi:peptidase T [Vallitalea guaymasensis]|uniref:Peptidase T n=1 Tax=Vallitalea guaymasensis TaxID=1185412 RepID=A0A8J8SD78_9FIRM|nr:peptidase T [Vallitalea guaymasensis]QUH30608.1 peptidase T [Vallitalea guaymasensis]